MCFETPQPLENTHPSVHTLNKPMQPSIQDLDGNLKFLEEEYESMEMEIAEQINDMPKDSWKYRAQKRFC